MQLSAEHGYALLAQLQFVNVVPQHINKCNEYVSCPLFSIFPCGGQNI